MKRVFSNPEKTIHAFAQQNQSEGRSSNVFFNGNVCYDYGYHYPLILIATNKKGEKAAIINTQGYSVTTSKHIGIARYAVNHYKRFDLPNTSAMKDLVAANDYKQPEKIMTGLSFAIESVVSDYKHRMLRDTVKRKPSTLERWKQEALSECNAYIELLDWYGAKLTKKANKALNELAGKSPIEAKELAAKAAARAEKARLKAQKERDARDLVAIKAAVQTFLRGETLDYNERNYLHRSETVHLRVNGDNVETSKGVQFAIRHAVKAFALIQTVMKKGETWQTNGKTLHLGEFKVETITPEGTVKAGCHTVHYPAIERVAKQLKLI